MKHFLSIKLIAIAGFIFLSTDSSLGMFLGLNMKGFIFFRNLCKIQDPTGPINARPLLCSFIHFHNATTPKPVFLCTGPNTDKFECTHYPTGKKCPATYNLMTGTMESNECEFEVTTTTTVKPAPAKPPPKPLHRRFCRGGPFPCDKNMKCPPEVTDGKCRAVLLS